MKKHLFLRFLAAVMPAFSASAGKIVTDSLRSEVLNSTVKYNIFLPDGFGKTDRQYPVV